MSKLQQVIWIASLAGMFTAGAGTALSRGPAQAHAPRPKLSQELSNRYFSPDSTVDIIVQFKAGAAGDAHSRVVERGGVLRSHLDLVRAKAYRVPAAQLGRLADDPDVELVAPDQPVHATAFSGTPDYGWMTVTGLSSMTATLPYDGTGVGVAIVDAGINDREDLKDKGGHMRIVYKQTFLPGKSDSKDHYGHGLHVAGIVGGSGARSSLYKIRGIAPNANLIDLRVLDDTGSGTDSSVIAAIQTAIQLKSKYNIRVLNLSLGRPVYTSYSSDPLCQAVEQAWRAGIVVVVAAGNEGRNDSAGNSGYGTITAPGNDPFVITVGAVNTLGTPARTDDRITSYSSKGPSLIDLVVKPDLVAPGNRIISLEGDAAAYLTKNYPQNKVPQYIYQASGTAALDYYQLSGTSMAAPMVSGAAAVLLQKNPSLTPDQVKAILMKTASKLPQATTVAFDPASGYQYQTDNDIFTVGAGYLDLAAALANTEIPSGDAQSLLAQYDTVSGTVFVSGGGETIWDSAATWSIGAVWGPEVVQPGLVGKRVSVVWGTAKKLSVVWGTGAGTADGIVWSTGSLAAEGAAIAIDGEN